MKPSPLVLLTLALAPSPLFAAPPIGSGVLIISDHCASGDPLCVEKRFVEAGKPLPKSFGTSSNPSGIPPAKTTPKAASKPSRSSVASDLRAAPNPAPSKDSPNNRPASAPQRGVKTVQTPGGYGYTFDGDSVDGQRIAPRDFIVASGPRAKVILSDELECQLPEEVTETYGFDRRRCDHLKPTRVVESGQVLAGELAAEFARTGECPKDFNDIQKLKQLVQAYERAPFEVEIAPLVGTPLDSHSDEIEPHLPVACGYNAEFNEWHKLQSYAESPSAFWSQQFEDGKKDDFQFVPTGTTGLWTLKGTNAAGYQSYRSGGTIGDMELIPLSSNVFVQTFRLGAPVGAVYWGLILIPSATQFQAQACEKARLLRTAPLAERPSIASDVQTLLMKSEALQRIQTLTHALTEEKNESTRTRLRAEARELFNVLEGESQIPGFKFGEMFCPDQPPSPVTR